MSTSAPWLALASDWFESRMLTGLGPEHMLAWIGILCHVKARGRGGVADCRPDLVARDMRVPEQVIDVLVKRAVDSGAIVLDQGRNTWTLPNWTRYQDPAKRKRWQDGEEKEHFSKTRLTNHPSPITHHPGQVNSQNAAHSPATARKAERTAGGGAVTWNPTAGFAGVTDADNARWAALYPSLEIPHELARAHDWLIANPTRAGKRNWRRFLSGWLARAHERPRQPRSANGAGRGSDLDRHAAAQQARASGEYEQHIPIPLPRSQRGGAVGA